MTLTLNTHIPLYIQLDFEKSTVFTFSIEKPLLPNLILP